MNDVASLPFLPAPTGPALFVDGGRQYDADSLLALAAAIDASVGPAAGVIVPHCQRRSSLAACLLASLQRNRPCVLPPAAGPEVLTQLHAQHPGARVVVDHEQFDASPEINRVPDVAAGGRTKAKDATVPASQIAAIAYTSGSTGLPSPQHKPWAALLGAATRFAERHGSGYSIVATVPAQHMYGLETTVMMALAGAGCVFDGTPFFPADIASALASMPTPRRLVTTPLHLRALVQSGVRLPAIAQVLSATAPLPVALARDAEAQFGAPVLEIYGCTEAGTLATRQQTLDPRWRLMPGLRLLPDAEAGEGRYRVMADYLPAPVPLADVLLPDDDDVFVLVGRSSDILKVGGKRIALQALTDALLALPGVQDAAVVVPNPDALHARPAALVVAPIGQEAALLDALRKTLDPAFLPRPLRCVSALPRNAVGKLPRAALLELLRD